jgi:hypothetical protein
MSAQDPLNNPQNRGARVFGSGNSGAEAVTPQAGAEAEQFVSQELTDARRAIWPTRILGIAVPLVLSGYLGYITNRFQESLQPQQAAMIAQGIIAQRVEEQAPAIAADMKQRIPALIENLPSYALQQMPQYRTRLENQIAGDLTTYANNTSTQLGARLDDFLQLHKDEVGQMIHDGQDPQLTNQVGAQLQQEFMQYLQNTSASNGETYQQKLDASLASLEEVKSKMDRLAQGKNLTPDEQKARHTIAILAAGSNDLQHSVAAPKAS